MKKVKTFISLVFEKLKIIKEWDNDFGTINLV